MTTKEQNREFFDNNYNEAIIRIRALKTKYSDEKLTSRSLEEIEHFIEKMKYLSDSL